MERIDDSELFADLDGSEKLEPVPSVFDNAIFLERFRKLEARDGLTLNDVASRIGWVNPKGKPDGMRVGKSIGAIKDGKRFRTTVRYDTAAALCDGLHIDYWEIGV